MNVAVLGNNFLANAVRHHCEQHFGTGPADVLWVCDQREYVRPKPGQLIVLSWPWPVGTCAKWERAYSNPVAVIPETVREAHAVEDFGRQPFMVIGTRHSDRRLWDLCAPFTDQVCPMSPESAEMTKIALNTFLAIQVAFGNDLGTVCEKVGADALAVATVLRKDPRIGKAYLYPGGNPGLHLERDVRRYEAMGGQVFA